MWTEVELRRLPRCRDCLCNTITEPADGILRLVRAFPSSRILTARGVRRRTLESARGDAQRMGLVLLARSCLTNSPALESDERPVLARRWSLLTALSVDMQCKDSTGLREAEPVESMPSCTLLSAKLDF